MRKFSHLAGAVAFAISSPALAAEADKSAGTEQLQIKPILDARLRYEAVDQGALDADAFTLRLRAGAEAKLGKLSLLAEGEGTAALVNHYNAFPFPIADSQRRPQYSVVSDPENIELNRVQLQYKSKDFGVTIGYIVQNKPGPDGKTSPQPFFTIWKRDSPAAKWLYIAE